MKIYNVHERRFNTSPEKVGPLLDSLSSANDRLWPKDMWPPMQFNAPLGVGAHGGHGPVHYRVSSYIPGTKVAFQFDGTGMTSGLDGRHLFEVIERRSGVILRHTVDAACDIRTWFTWHLAVGPMHDALLEDGLDNAEKALTGGIRKPARWSPWVKFLRKRIKARAA
jgi:hypothetical protein